LIILEKIFARVSKFQMVRWLGYILAKSKLFIIQYPVLGYSILEYNMSYS
jgi:hypothetical protein